MNERYRQSPPVATRALRRRRQSRPDFHTPRPINTIRSGRGEAEGTRATRPVCPLENRRTPPFPPRSYITPRRRRVCDRGPYLTDGFFCRDPTTGGGARYSHAPGVLPPMSITHGARPQKAHSRRRVAAAVNAVVSRADTKLRRPQLTRRNALTRTISKRLRARAYSTLFVFVGDRAVTDSILCFYFFFPIVIFILI